MMRCENCSHECTVVDFVTFRNLCEHLYLDALAKKQHFLLASTSIPINSERAFQSLSPRAIEDPASQGEFVPLER